MVKRYWWKFDELELWQRELALSVYGYLIEAIEAGCVGFRVESGGGGRGRLLCTVRTYPLSERDLYRP